MTDLTTDKEGARWKDKHGLKSRGGSIQVAVRNSEQGRLTETSESKVVPHGFGQKRQELIRKNHGYLREKSSFWQLLCAKHLVSLTLLCVRWIINSSSRRRKWSLQKGCDLCQRTESASWGAKIQTKEPDRKIHRLNHDRGAACTQHGVWAGLPELCLGQIHLQAAHEMARKEKRLEMGNQKILWLSKWETEEAWTRTRERKQRDWLQKWREEGHGKVKEPTGFKGQRKETTKASSELGRIWRKTNSFLLQVLRREGHAYCSPWCSRAWVRDTCGGEHSDISLHTDALSRDLYTIIYLISAMKLKDLSFQEKKKKPTLTYLWVSQFQGCPWLPVFPGAFLTDPDETAKQPRIWWERG